ncbi:MAG: 1-acyl-sn-glycerol-3-phosphate acyltransferase [Chloroflexota bacterium]
MALFRWKLIGEPPTTPKLVLIAAPHSSNWDLPIMLLVAIALKRRLSWMVKDSAFGWPILGWLFKRWGGIPIDRSSKNDTVQQMVAAFAERDELALAIPPAGTRGKRDYWKSGFYYIALKAQVPVLFGFIDFGRRETGLGSQPLHLTGNMREDMDVVRDFYGDMLPKHPHLLSPIRLRQEEEDSTA